MYIIYLKNLTFFELLNYVKRRENFESLKFTRLTNERSTRNQLVLLPPLSLVCTLYIESQRGGSERYRNDEGFRFVEKQRADLHGKSLISLVITVRHRMEYVFMIILYRMIISSASPHNRIVDRLYHTVWRSEELCSVLAVLRS